MVIDRIDVVEDYEYSSENPQYNQDYRHWRRHAKGPWMYQFQENSREHVYVDGGAASSTFDAALAERKALLHCSTVIGTILLIFLVSEILGSTAMVALMRLFMKDISIDFLSFQTVGNQWARTGVRILIEVLKYSLPTAVLTRFCKLPQSVFAPASFGAIPEVIAAIGSGMVIAALYCVTTLGTSVELSQRLFSYKDSAAIAAFGVFDALAVSVLAELFFRGALLPVLRQFGDPFAVIVTAVIAFLCPNVMSDRIRELLIGLAAGYLMIRSGSILKCAMLRITCSALCYARLVLVYANETIPLWRYVLTLAVIGSMTVVFYCHIRRTSLPLPNRQSFLPLKRKLYYMTQSIPMLPWLAVSLLLLLL